MVGDHIYLNIGGIFSLKPFNLTGIAGGLLFISLSFDEPLLKQYNEKDLSKLATWHSSNRPSFLYSSSNTFSATLTDVFASFA